MRFGRKNETVRAAAGAIAGTTAFAGLGCGCYLLCTAVSLAVLAASVYVVVLVLQGTGVIQ